jgi:hypothetical protein
MSRRIGGALVAGSMTLAVLLCVSGFNAGPRADDRLSHSRLTYDEARARLLRCTRWHLTDSRLSTSCWVTHEPRQAEELERVVLVQDLSIPRSSRRGVIRVQPLQVRAMTIYLDSADTSYWRLVGDVYLAGDPDLVGEVAAYLANDDGGP